MIDGISDQVKRIRAGLARSRHERLLRSIELSLGLDKRRDQVGLLGVMPGKRLAQWTPTPTVPTASAVCGVGWRPIAAKLIADAIRNQVSASEVDLADQTTWQPPAR